MAISLFFYVPGDKALRQVIEDSRKIADRCTNPADRDLILRSASDVESMVNALSELRTQGKVGIMHVIHSLYWLIDGRFFTSPVHHQRWSQGLYSLCRHFQIAHSLKFVHQYHVKKKNIKIKLRYTVIIAVQTHDYIFMRIKKLL